MFSRALGTNCTGGCTFYFLPLEATVIAVQFFPRFALAGGYTSSVIDSSP